MTPSLSLWGGVAVLVTCAVAAMTADMVRRTRWLPALAAAISVLVGAVWLWEAWTGSVSLVGVFFATGGGFSAVAGLIVVLSGLVVFTDHLDGHGEAQRTSLILLGATGAALAAHSLHPIAVVITLETTAIASYALVAFDRTPHATEAAIKYFIQGALSTGLLIVGAAVIIGLTGGGLVGFGVRFGQEVPVSVGFGVTLMVSAVLFKVGAAPMHSWTADAYSVSSNGVPGILAGPVKLGMAAALVMLVGTTAPQGMGLEVPGSLVGTMLPALAAVGALSMVVGTLLALRQHDLRRMLAYAGVAQVGYALVASASGQTAAALFFMSTYAVGSVVLFTLADVVTRGSGDWDGGWRGLRGVGRRHPVIGLAATVSLLSLAGLPPLAGFWGKLLVFQSAISRASAYAAQGRMDLMWWYAVAVVVAVVAAVVAVAYYGRIVGVLYAHRPDDDEGPMLPTGASTVSTVLMAAAVVTVGLVPFWVPIKGLLLGFTW